MADAINDYATAVHAVVAVNALVGSAWDVGRLGAEALAEYPRVVWVSAGGGIEPVDDVGGRSYGGARTRQIRTDAADIDLHIWGADREATRDIMHALVAAMWQVSQGSCSFGRYTWITEATARAEFATHGAKVVLSASVRLPVVEAALSLTVIAAQTQTVTFTDPAV